MGAITSTLGLGGSGDSGSAGSNFNANMASIVTPATAEQATTAYNQTQTGLSNQQNFLNALQAQNGIGNQSAVYNQLAGIANGTGPNPAQAQLQQATGANTANQAALMAGQRGAGANTGLIARQAAQQGAANQQNAVGQAATMNAQQQMNAINSMGNLATTQVGQQGNAANAYSQSAQGQQSNILNAIGQLNSANVANQSQATQGNAGVAQNVAKTQGSFISGAIGGISGGLTGFGAKGGAVVKGGIQNFANGTTDGPVQIANTGGQSSITAPAPVAAPAASPWANAMNNLGKQPGSNGGSDPISESGFHTGSTLGKSIRGLFTSAPDPSVDLSTQAGMDSVQSAVDAQGANGNVMGSEQIGSGGMPGEGGGTMNSATSSDMSGMGGATGGMEFAHGGKVPAMVSPGERYLPPNEVKKVAEGKKSPLKAGEKIPGKAKVKGDSLKNDVVPKTLEEGGIVLPKSVMESKHPHWEAHKFVSAIMAKQGLKKR